MTSLKIVSTGVTSEIYLNGHKIEGVQSITVRHTACQLPVVTLRVVADVESEQTLNNLLLKKAPPRGWARRIPVYIWWSLKRLLGGSQVRGVYCHKDKDNEWRIRI